MEARRSLALAITAETNREFVLPGMSAIFFNLVWCSSYTCSLEVVPRVSRENMRSWHYVYSTMCRALCVEHYMLSLMCRALCVENSDGLHSLPIN